MRLNLGSGGKKLPGWVNVDSQPMEDPDIVVDLSQDIWPWRESSVDEVFASHVLEHIGPVPQGFFHFMREVYRVCKPGAGITFVLPHPSHDIYLNDPTHVHPVMPGTLAMFSKKYSDTLALKGQRLTPFWKYLGVDFDLGKIKYWFDPAVDREDPELGFKSKHFRNIIFEWGTTLTVVK